MIDQDFLRSGEAFRREIAIDSLDEQALRFAALQLEILAEQKLHHLLRRQWIPLARSKVVFRYYLKRQDDGSSLHLQYYWLCLAVKVLDEPIAIEILTSKEESGA